MNQIVWVPDGGKSETLKEINRLLKGSGYKAVDISPSHNHFPKWTGKRYEVPFKVKAVRVNGVLE